jgi:hypothetical protein
MIYHINLDIMSCNQIYSKTHDIAAYLWSYEVSQQERQGQKQYPDPVSVVSCYVLASMLVNVHVIDNLV